MNPVRVVGWASVLWLMTAGAGRVDAGWHNVFQVCCNNCGREAWPITRACRGLITRGPPSIRVAILVRKFAPPVMCSVVTISP